MNSPFRVVDLDLLEYNNHCAIFFVELISYNTEGCIFKLFKACKPVHVHFSSFLYIFFLPDKFSLYLSFSFYLVMIGYETVRVDGRGGGGRGRGRFPVSLANQSVRGHIDGEEGQGWSIWTSILPLNKYAGFG